ncbi:Maf-like protein [Lacticaseibacillus paracasei subsp. paracasei Lpp48]|nr:Maf-like protein [Lacticaseibacillus paracasei subsp. paracasei Lpp48]WPH54256.1 Maf family protein [Lacticaseibacillus paracasei]
MIILASHSPRRQELLKRIVPDFESHPASINERALPVLDPPAYVQSLATAKGQSLVPSYPEATIIAADTMVAFQGKLLGKPHDRAEAKQMITALGGQTHQVYTGLWVRLDNGSVRQQVVTTDVTFWPLSEADVESYLAEDAYQDKAGAYGIQDAGALLVKSIHGDFYNVMGLPISTLYRMLLAEPQ